MNNKNNLDDIPQEALDKMATRLSYFGAVLIAAAVVGVCFAITRIDNTVIKIVVAAIAAVVGLIGIFIVLVANIGAREVPEEENNFFLYNKKRKQNIDLSELTVSLIREKTFVKAPL